MRNTQHGIYKNSYDTKGVIVSIEAVVDRIRSGAKGLDERRDTATHSRSPNRKGIRRIRKGNCRQSPLRAHSRKGSVSPNTSSQHSGLVVIDIDGLTEQQITDFLVELAQNPYIVLAFVSPSGQGIKAVVRVNPVPQNDMEHKGAWKRAKTSLTTSRPNTAL